VQTASMLSHPNIVTALDENSLADRREITIPLARRILAHHQDVEGD